MPGLTVADPGAVDVWARLAGHRACSLHPGQVAPADQGVWAGDYRQGSPAFGCQ